MSKIFKGLLLAGLAFGSLFLYSNPVAAQDKGDSKAFKATTAESKMNAGWWKKRHEQKLAELAKKKGEVDLLFIGDSITHGWENKNGNSTFEKYYGKRKPFNIGYSGDRTENVIWRLQNGEVEGISPKLAVIMIGTNNTGHRQDPPAETAAGIKAIIKELSERLPKTKVLLLGVFPRGQKADDAKRKINVGINEIAKGFDDGKMVHYLNIDSIFLTEDGTLPKSIMPDALHPNAEGYKKWAAAMEPKIKELMGE